MVPEAMSDYYLFCSFIHNYNNLLLAVMLKCLLASIFVLPSMIITIAIVSLWGHVMKLIKNYSNPLPHLQIEGP